jgi:hypothetical protein
MASGRLDCPAPAALAMSMTANSTLKART